ncbi:MAG: hypothetical protein H6605_08615 [Flavobacteriales bacterium]|nr:hypothetical protein [Flavobacteriales bacterium]
MRRVVHGFENDNIQSGIKRNSGIAVSELFGETMTLSFPVDAKGKKGIGAVPESPDEKDLGWIAGVA